MLFGCWSLLVVACRAVTVAVDCCCLLLVSVNCGFVFVVCCMLCVVCCLLLQFVGDARYLLFVVCRLLPVVYC